ncbi:MAG: hypothetical protein RIR97_1536 [Pseudomonadota bacterium]
MTRISKAACVGGGVIGGGWIARFVLAGIDVNVYDPHPESERIIGEIMANATRAYDLLTMAPLPKPGRITFCKSLQEAVQDAEWIQESVPERLDLKRGVITQIDRAARPDALIGSSTSGLLPSDLQVEMTHPERMFVAHPYNPVYLLPLAELVGGKKTSLASIERAGKLLETIGMKGVHITKEIEAFVGDRLLETLWREALWLIKDDICTVETLDDIMRYSFGMRWAQMGLFQTYRIAGGEAGMRHFINQFGPCLDWPWSKLTNNVDLNDELVEKIGQQSDEQAAGLSIRELERIRDENLVGIMQTLKGGHGGKGWGAGKLLADFEERLWATAPKAAVAPTSEPIRLLETKVHPSWIDYNGHMTEYRYMMCVADSVDLLLRSIGADADYVAGGHSYYTAESHIRHLGEGHLGDQLYVTCQIIPTDEKRLHTFQWLHRASDGKLLATGEHMLLHVSSADSKVCPAKPEVWNRLKPLMDAHAGLPSPEGAGRSVGQKK